MEQTSTPNREQAPTSGRETQKSEDAEVVGVPLSLSRAARYVSAVFSPLLIPTYAVAMAMWITPLNTTPENVRFMACVLVLFYYRRHTHGNAVDAATIGTHHRC